MADGPRHSPADVSVSRALPFAAIPGYRPLELDLYRPPAADPLPVVIYLHGGGWRQGTREAASPGFRDWNPGVLARLAAAGFAVVSADYRLSGEARFPAQLEDVYRAFDWVAASGKAHGADPSRVLLWGDSAGGHLAALAATGGAQVRPTPGRLAPHFSSRMVMPTLCPRASRAFGCATGCWLPARR